MNKLERCASSSWMGMQRVKGVTASVAALNSHSHWSLHACNTIGAVASTVDSVTMLGLVHMYTHAHTHTHTCAYIHRHHTHTPSTQSPRWLTLYSSLCTTYEQTWEMCKFIVDGCAKGEGSDSISRSWTHIYTGPCTWYIWFDLNYLTFHPVSYMYSHCNTVSHCLMIMPV